MVKAIVAENNGGENQNLNNGTLGSGLETQKRRVGKLGMNYHFKKYFSSKQCKALVW